MVNSIDPYTHRERGPSPGMTVLRDIAAAFKRGCMRSGQAQSQAMIWLAVIGGILILGASAIGLYWLFIRGSEDQALKSNIDRVAAEAEVYWQQYSADRHGRRDIDLAEFCNYANAQFAVGDDLILRTLGVGPTTGGAVTAAARSTVASTAISDGIADHIAAFEPTSGDLSTESSAKCPDDGAPSSFKLAAANEPGYDLLVMGGAATAFTAGGVMSDPLDGTAAVELDDLKNVGLVSTNSVWMAQLHGFPITGLPSGARSATGEANEVLVFGGVSPGGNSFCLIKVFSASDRGSIGEYRVAHKASDTDATPFAVCTTGAIGTTATGKNTPRFNAGWPEAR